MKKTLSILLAVVLMFALTLPVLAEDVPSENVSGSSSAVVNATYQKGDVNQAATVYLVTVAWDVQSSLTYTEGDTTYTWDAVNTKYTATTGLDGWDGEATVAITVTNKSNAAITATATWEDAGDIQATCTYTDSKNTISVGSAADSANIEENDLEGAPVDGTISGTVTVQSGSISESDNTVGTVTLSIEKAN